MTAAASRTSSTPRALAPRPQTFTLADTPQPTVGPHPTTDYVEIRELIYCLATVTLSRARKGARLFGGHRPRTKAAIPPSPYTRSGSVRRPREAARWGRCRAGRLIIPAKKLI